MRRYTSSLTSSPRTSLRRIVALVLLMVMSIGISSDERALADDPDCPLDPLGQVGDDYWYECCDHAQDCWGRIVERSSPVELTQFGCDSNGDCYNELEKVFTGVPDEQRQVQRRHLEMSETFVPHARSGYCVQWCGYAKLKNGNDGEEYGFKIFTLMRYRPFEPIRVRYIGEECKNDLCVTWNSAKWTEPDGKTPKYRHEINVTVGTKPNVPITFTVTTVNAVVEQK